MSVNVAPGQSIQAAVNANQAGTTFILLSGTHHAQSVTPKAGNSFIGEAGTILDGDGTTAQAFTSTGADNVTIRGLTIRNYAPGSQDGAIKGPSYSYYWLIEDCDISYNANWGVRVYSYWTVRNCHIHHNGVLGLGGGGTDTIIDSCEIDWNNTSHADSYFEAGGFKFVYSDGMVITGCNIHDNEGPGAWFDGTNVNTEITGNQVTDNYGPGIFYEINNGPCLIEDNDVDGNGFGWTSWLDGAGILLGTASNTEIRYNRLRYNHDGIGIIFADRSPWQAEGNYVHHNEVWSDHADARSGMVTNISGCEPWNIPTWDNIFDYNTYHFGPNNPATPFYGDPYNSTFAQWQAQGQDVHSTVSGLTDDDITASPAAAALPMTGVRATPVATGGVAAHPVASALALTAPRATPLFAGGAVTAPASAVFTMTAPAAIPLFAGGTVAYPAAATLTVAAPKTGQAAETVTSAGWGMLIR